jgi:hypothetical protein
LRVIIGFAIFLLVLPDLAVLAQESTPLSVDTPVPKAILRQSYHFQLKAHGGITPYKWEIASGSPPNGIELGNDGILSGIPAATGEFHFVVTVSDHAKPAQQRNQELVMRVTAALVAEWKRPPQISGGRLQGSVAVSNGSDDDFDLTVIVLAVNEIGKAFATAYQHGTLKKDESLEVPFDESLPSGTYIVNGDVVGEIPARNVIYRARLFTGTPMKVP